MNLEVVLGVERPGVGVELFRCHREREAVFLAGKARSVIAAVAVDHALRKSSGVDQFRQRGSEMVVLFIELALCAQYHPHIPQRRGLRLGTSRISWKLGLVG